MRYLIVVVLLSLFTAPTAAQSPPGHIIFSTWVEGRYGEPQGANQIYQMNPDGTGLTLLVDDLPTWVIPVLSPDNRYLAFRMESAVYVLDLTQTDAFPIRQLGRPLVAESAAYNPVWTPDSQNLLFARLIEEGLYEVYTISVEGGTARRLSLLPAAGVISVLPDGRIAYPTPVENNFLPLVVTDADGSNPVFVTEETAGDQYRTCDYDWSPMGFSLVINISTEDAGCASVYGPPYRNSGDTSRLEPMAVADDAYFFWLTWSPDGSRIGAATYELDPIGYYTFAPDGSDLRYIGGERILPDADEVRSPSLSNLAWSPDGDYLAFAWSYANPAGAVLYIANADGSGSTPILRFDPDIVHIVSVAWGQ